jgi:hypothetical protein
MATVMPPACSLHPRGFKSFCPIRSPGPSFGSLQNYWPPTKYSLVYENVMSLTSQLVGFAWGSLRLEAKVPPNSSPSKAKLNPDEPNLWLTVSSLPKASPPWVGVEMKLLLLSLCFVKKSCTWYHRTTGPGGCAAILCVGLTVLGHCHFWGALLFVV